MSMAAKEVISRMGMSRFMILVGITAFAAGCGLGDTATTSHRSQGTDTVQNEGSEATDPKETRLIQYGDEIILEVAEHDLPPGFADLSEEGQQKVLDQLVENLEPVEVKQFSGYGWGCNRWGCWYYNRYGGGWSNAYGSGHWRR